MAEMLPGTPRDECLRMISVDNELNLTQAEMEEVGHTKRRYLEEAFRGLSENDLRSGVIEFVEQLRARGVKCGLYSLCSSARTVVERLGLDNRFETLVDGAGRSHVTWDASLFERCAQNVRVPGFHCLVVESTVHGVEAALKGRMKVLGIGDGAHRAGAREVVDDFSRIHVDFLLDSGRVSKYPEQPWSLTETVPRPGRTRYWETLFALSNGFMGLRGAHEEEDPAVADYSYPGMFLNRIHGYQPYSHVLAFPGYPKHLHVMLNLADWRIINLEVNGQRFSVHHATISEYRRSLDVRGGMLERSLVWDVPGGGRVRLRSQRIVSMTRRHVAAIRYEVEALDRPVHVTLESAVQATVASEELGPQQTRVVSASHENDLMTLHVQPTTASADIGMAFTHVIQPGARSRKEGWEAEPNDRLTRSFEATVSPGSRLVCDKFAAFCTHIEMDGARVDTCASGEVSCAAQVGFEALAAEQRRFWEDYWRIADIRIDGSVADQQAVRFNLFHLRQSNPEDDRRSIGANGMTGDKYRGHVFWDTEMYLVPHFLYTEPQTVRSLLMYRHDILDRARERARELGGVGALYSWNSISGEECGVVFEASTAEYHLLSAIAYAIRGYSEAVDDREFLFQYGAEILFETARFLENRGAYVPHKGGAFCINVVCGPDEYGCGVNNNCYTNVMVQWHLRYAAEVYERMADEAPSVLSRLADRIDIDKEEPVRWRRAAEAMYIPYNEALGIHEQDDSFLSLDPVDMSMIPRNTDIRETMHPLNLWRMQVAKQADVVLLMFVQGHQFDMEIKRRNYEFYEPRTCHGSSLSASMHAIVAAEIGKQNEAYDYFRESASMDLNDFKDNTGGGIHSACLGGTWMAVVNGFGGVRDYPDGLRFSPMLPEAWRAYSFMVLYRGARIGVEVTNDRATYRLLEGDRVAFVASGRRVELEAGQTVDVSVPLTPHVSVVASEACMPDVQATPPASQAQPRTKQS